MENEFLKRLKTAYKGPTNKICVCVCVHTRMHKCVYQGPEWEGDKINEFLKI